VASRIAVETIDQRIQGVSDPPRQLLEAVEEANRRILRDQQANPERLGMGTTLSALWVPDVDTGNGWIAHIGDSRIYRFRDDALEQLTDDHSPVYRLYKEGALQKDQLRFHPQKNLIERSLGLAANIQCDIFTTPVRPGDRFLLCTDGLCDCVSDTEMAESLRTVPWDDLPADLISRALRCGGFDNITVVLVEVLGA
jgi:protein phosphatase